MPDENGTEATRSDGPSADGSLFGEAADDTGAAVADEQDANKEPDREGTSSLMTQRSKPVSRRI